MRLPVALLALLTLTAPALGQPVDEHGFPIPGKPKPPKSGVQGVGMPSGAKLPNKASYGPTLDPLVRKLKSANDRDRLGAAKELGKMGTAAAPAARPICDACADKSELVARAAFEALEAVRPDLHAPVVMLVMDSDNDNKLKATEQLGAMREGGKPALGILMSRLAALGVTAPEEVYRGTTVKKAITYEAVLKVAPDDQEVTSFFFAWAGPNRPQTGNFWRHHALQHLVVEYAGVNEKRRAEVAPYVVAGLEDKHCQFYCIGWAGDYGVVCKAALLMLKRLKISPDAATRKAATEAIAKIEDK